MSMTESERYTWRDDGEAYSNYIRPAVTKRLAEYEDIGTVEEFRELKEKAAAKKPLHQGFVYACPCCNDKVSIGSTILRPNQNFCIDCGTEFDWSEGKE